MEFKPTLSRAFLSLSLLSLFLKIKRKNKNEKWLPAFVESIFIKETKETNGIQTRHFARILVFCLLCLYLSK